MSELRHGEVRIRVLTTCSEKDEDVTGYDVIGDVHGHADALEGLLVEMGYRRSGGVYRHPERQAVFLGDLIDRGPDQLRTLQLAREMVDDGSALIVMGNHEFNAIAWATRCGDGRWAREHSEKNERQHRRFLAEVGDDTPSHRDWVEWFETIPLWLDLGGLRVVHACWHEASMDALDGHTMGEIVTADKGDTVDDAIEVILKGPEVKLNGHSFTDSDGHDRYDARFRWWDSAATTLRTAAEVPGGVPDHWIGIDDELNRDGSLPEPPTEVPVLFGHYWRTGTPKIHGPKAACLDYSIARGGALVAYRWSGEQDLTDEHLVAVV